MRRSPFRRARKGATLDVSALDGTLPALVMVDVSVLAS